MQQDMLQACASFLRTQPDLVAAFGDAPSADPPVIAFWTDFAGTGTPSQFLVLTEPTSTETFESPDSGGEVWSTADGTIAVQVYAESKTQVRQLADMVIDAMNDAALPVNGLIYFRRTNRQFPVMTGVGPGPDSPPTYYSRVVQFRYLIETPN